MNEDEYFKKLKRKLWMIKADKRSDLINEIRSDFEERKRSGENPEKIIGDLPSPEDLRKEYLEIYGASGLAILLVTVAGCIISLFTVSIFPFSSIPFYPSPLFLVVLALFIAYISNVLGRKTGFMVSVSAGIFRVVILYLTIIMFNPPIEKGTDIMEMANSLVIALIPIFIKKERGEN